MSNLLLPDPTHRFGRDVCAVHVQSLVLSLSPPARRGGGVTDSLSLGTDLELQLPPLFGHGQSLVWPSPHLQPPLFMEAQARTAPSNCPLSMNLSVILFDFTDFVI